MFHYQCRWHHLWMISILLLPGLLQAQPLQLRGVVMPVKESKLGFSQSGTLITLPQEGQKVTQGDVVATIRDQSKRIALTKAEAALLETKISLAKARAGLQTAKLGLKIATHSRDKTSRLKGKSIVSKMALVEAEFEVQQAQLEVKTARFMIQLAQAKVKQAEVTKTSAELDLAGCTLRAPFSGTITSVTGKMGEWTVPTTPILKLADLSELTLSIDLKPDLAKNLLSDKSTNIMDDHGKTIGRATIKTILPFIDAASGLQRIKWSILPMGKAVLSGRYVTLHLK
ncbi:efflux RND transporter periplasmic adaptor subunit [Magnetococcales bacterium HHB-1]